MLNNIHPTAIIEDGVSLGTNNIIGAYSIIRKGSIIGSNNLIESFVEIGARATTRLEIRNWRTVVENNNIISSHTILQSTSVLGTGNHLHNNVTIGHHSKIGNHNTLRAYVGISSNVLIGDCNVLCPYTGVASFIEITNGSHIGSYSGINRHILPYSKVIGGHRAHLAGFDMTSIRKDFDSEASQVLIQILSKARFHKTKTKFLKEIEAAPDCYLKGLFSHILSLNGPVLLRK